MQGPSTPRRWSEWWEVPEPTVARRDRTAFLLILAFGAALRLFHLTAPFVDAHAWRQLDTAAMARNFYESSFIPFDPQVAWGGRTG